ncbi:MAG: aldo/keto reductase [Anaerolineae bacterium]|jgi:aryl-alcohol dehydrogenase-like predicted oxidoreductase
MRYRSMGGTGVRISAVSLGTGGQWGGRVDRSMAARIVATALDHGINYIDTADIYGTWYEGRRPLAEEHLGAALQGLRDRVVLGTKGCQATGDGPNDWGASRYHLTNALEASLRRLRTDHVDLYQIHLYDAATPAEETMRALEDMVRSGKTRYVGASQYQAWQICRCNDLAERYGWARFVTTQAHYNLLEREAERELLPFCRAMDVGLFPYFALANGLLAGRYEQGAPPPPDSRAAAFERTRRYLDTYATPANYAILGRLTAFAEQRDHTLADLSIAWLLAEPAVASVITGASSPQQIAANAQAASWELDEAELAQVRTILEEAV